MAGGKRSHLHTENEKNALAGGTSPNGCWKNRKLPPVTLSLLDALYQSLRVLLSEPDLERAVGMIMKLVGKHYRIGRVFAYVHDEALVFDCRHAWNREDIPEDKRLQQGVRLDMSSCSMLELLEKDGMVAAADIFNLPPDAYDHLIFQDIRALLLLPIWADRGLAGFVGFEDNKPRDWSPEEMVMLWNLCIVLCGFRRGGISSSAERTSLLIKDILSNTGLNVTVSDPETQEVVWNNDEADPANGCRDYYAGRKCYEAAYGREGYCPFCRAGGLAAGTEGHASFEYRDEASGRIIKMYNHIAPWDDGQRMLIEYSLDITEQRAFETRRRFDEGK